MLGTLMISTVWYSSWGCSSFCCWRSFPSRFKLCLTSWFFLWDSSCPCEFGQNQQIYIYIHIHKCIKIKTIATRSTFIYIYIGVQNRNQTNNSICTYTHIINIFSELPPEPVSAFFGGPYLDILYVCLYVYIYIYIFWLNRFKQFLPQLYIYIYVYVHILVYIHV